MMKFLQSQLLSEIVIVSVFIAMMFFNYQPIESELGGLIVNDIEQQRTTLTESQILKQYAICKANDMASKNYFNHTTPEGFTPNQLLREKFHYELPDYYSDGNNVESIALNYASANEILKAFRNSESHREHIFGKTKFYQEQNEYGIGIVYTNDSIYIVVVIAKHK